ncbi:MAG: dihydrofolate reductase [Saccharofermentanales bacterium]|jgi:dihydrofolate reductase
MNLIVAVDNNWGIGFKDRLLFRIHEDLKRFRALTIGKTVILGRRTLVTFPGGRPLERRMNIVMTRDKHFRAEPAWICHSLEQLGRFLYNIPDDGIFVIGGASIYEQFLPYCRTAYVTRIEQSAEADRYFPDLDRQDGWSLISCQDYISLDAQVEGRDEQVELQYSFCVYEQEKPRRLFL